MSSKRARTHRRYLLLAGYLALLAGLSLLPLSALERVLAAMAGGLVFLYADARWERRALAERASRDALTGLLNTRSTAEMARRALTLQKNVGLIMVDLDDFKSINDQFGHLWGDRAIEGTAKVLLKAARPGDVAGRVGGDEFVMLLADAEEGALSSLAERVRRDVEQTRVGDAGAHPLSCSVGAAMAQAGDSWESLYRRADEAMYRAKRRKAQSADAPEHEPDGNHDRAQHGRP